MPHDHDPGDDEALEALVRDPQAWFRLLRDTVTRPLMRRERPSHTLQPTALANEVVLRLLRQEDGPFATTLGAWLAERDDRELSRPEIDEFLSRAWVAAQHVLVDHARGKRARKRGGDRTKLPYEADVHDPLVSPEASPDAFLDVHDALDRLGGVQPELAETFRRKAIHGLSSQEIADHLGVDKRTVDRRFDRARIWLRMELEKGRAAAE